MAETEAISRMAEKLSNELFTIFRWSRVGPKNQNWECVNKELHETNNGTHPSDVVFSYRDPFKLNTEVLFNFDLKSYAKGTINKSSVRVALNSLCKATACCSAAPEWLELYSNEELRSEVHGSLFVYNHDGEFDKTFSSLIPKNSEAFGFLNERQQVYAFSPERVCLLSAVAIDIPTLLHKNGSGSNYFFYYPDEGTQLLHVDKYKAPLTIKKMMSNFLPVIIEKDGRRIFYGYCLKEYSAKESFVYLIDYLFQKQLFDLVDKIVFRGVQNPDKAASQFEKAKVQYRYIVNSDGDDRVGQCLDLVAYESITMFNPHFSEIELGFEV